MVVSTLVAKVTGVVSSLTGAVVVLMVAAAELVGIALKVWAVLLVLPEPVFIGSNE